MKWKATGEQAAIHVLDQEEQATLRAALKILNQARDAWKNTDKTFDGTVAFGLGPSGLDQAAVVLERYANGGCLGFVNLTRHVNEWPTTIEQGGAS